MGQFKMNCDCQWKYQSLKNMNKVKSELEKRHENGKENSEEEKQKEQRSNRNVA